MKKIKKNDIGGNNFLLSVGIIFLILSLFVGINTKVVEIINLKEILNFDLKEIYLAIPALIGCTFILWAFSKN